MTKGRATRGRGPSPAARGGGFDWTVLERSNGCMQLINEGRMHARKHTEHLKVRRVRQIRTSDANDRCEVVASEGAAELLLLALR
jgi:hypothetical protein